MVSLIFGCEASVFSKLDEVFMIYPGLLTSSRQAHIRQAYFDYAQHIAVHRNASR
jgi:hypothetical protein